MVQTRLATLRDSPGTSEQKFLAKIQLGQAN
jgi:hypothetical protein